MHYKYFILTPLLDLILHCCTTRDEGKMSHHVSPSATTFDEYGNKIPSFKLTYVSSSPVTIVVLKVSSEFYLTNSVGYPQNPKWDIRILFLDVDVRRIMAGAEQNTVHKSNTKVL